MGYKLLGFVVWRLARWLVRRRLDRMLSSRRVAAAAVVAGVVGIAAVLAARRDAK
jgi:predicted PurR-regulated permease PerM